MISAHGRTLHSSKLPQRVLRIDLQFPLLEPLDSLLDHPRCSPDFRATVPLASECWRTTLVLTAVPERSGHFRAGDHTTNMVYTWLLSWVCPSKSSGIITNSWKRSTIFALCIQFGQCHAFKNSLLASPWRFFAFIEQWYDSKWQQREIGISQTVALATRNHKKPPSFWPHAVLLGKPWETELQSVSNFSEEPAGLCPKSPWPKMLGRRTKLVNKNFGKNADTRIQNNLNIEYIEFINVWARTKFTKASLVLNPFCIPPGISWSLGSGLSGPPSQAWHKFLQISDFRFHSCFGHDTILVQSTCEKTAWLLWPPTLKWPKAGQARTYPTSQTLQANCPKTGCKALQMEWVTEYALRDTVENQEFNCVW